MSLVKNFRKKKEAGERLIRYQKVPKISKDIKKDMADTCSFPQYNGVGNYVKRYFTSRVRFIPA